MPRLRPSLAALLLVVAFGASAAADEPWSSFALAVGRYDGQAASGGSLVPVTTNLDFANDGTIAGDYSFVQDGVTYRGTLFRSRVAGPRTLVFIWQDDWGFGTLQMEFTAGFDSFVGVWGPLDDGADAFPWVGVKANGETP